MRFSTEPLDTPLVQAAVLDSVGDVCRQLALFNDAERLLNEALQIRRKYLAVGDADLATSCFHTAWYYHERGNFERAKPLYLEALEIRQQLLQGKALVAETLQNLAWLHYAEKSPDDMDQCFEQALRIREKLLDDARGQKVSDDRCQPLLRDVVYTKLGWAAANTGLKRPLDVKRIASDPLLKKQLIELRMKNLADALDKFLKAGDEIGFGEFTEAIDDLKQCLALIKGEGKAETTLAAGVNFVLANTLTRKNRLPEAETHYRAAFDIVRRSQMFQIPEQSPKIMEFAELLRRLGKTSEANQLWEEYLAAQKFRFGDQHRFYGEAAAGYKAFRFAPVAK